MKKRIGTAPMINNAKLKKLLQDKEVELWETKRQLEIEAALEKVRSLTMVMKRSDDLSEIILTVYKELRQLDIALTRTLIWLFSENPDMFEVWVADTEADTTSFVMKQEVEHPYHKRMFDAWKKRKSKWVYINEGEGKKDLDDYLFTKTAAIAVPEEVKAGIRAVNRIVNSFSFHNFGCLQADGAEELSEENFEIMYRFAKEFDLAYTRFLDLQKAEAQAKEAEIEAALERVRARSMAMQDSIELMDVVEVLYDQFDSLGIADDMTDIEICLIDEDTGVYTVWQTPESLTGDEGNLKLPITASTQLKKEFAAWKKTPPKQRSDLFFNYVLESGELKNFLSKLKMLEGWEHVLDVFKKNKIKRWVTCNAYFQYGMLTYQNVEKKGSEIDELLPRFAKVFEQTYTRFLDLKKAEAQAREAQIEAALERVRSRTMAMHRSEEIADIVGKILEELGNLDIVLTRVLIWIFNKKEKYVDWWSANSELNNTAESYRLDFNQNPVFLTYLKAWEKKIPLLKYKLSGDVKISWEDYIFNNTGLAEMPVEVQNGMREEGTIYTTSAISSYGLMMAGSREPLSGENTDIIQRFGLVFQQSYTRYLDVQKAEAQALEAQIEASLEKVRARAMAMHKSEELSEAAVVLYEELQKLGLKKYFNCGYVEVDEKNNRQYGWTSTFDGKMAEGCLLPLSGDPVLDERYKSWEKRVPVFYQVVGGEQLKNHLKFAIPHLGSEQVIRMVKDQFPDPTIFYCCNFSHGYLHFITDGLLSSEEEALLSRFTRVFEMAYKRFLDLKKAEEQAREAQIETALERIRARALAMHSSEELEEVVNVLREQMGKLGQSGLQTCAIHIYIEDSETFESWYAFSRPGKVKGRIFTGTAHFRKDACSLTKKWIRKYKSDEKDYLIKARGAELKAWLDIRNKNVPEIKKFMNEYPPLQFYQFSDFSSGSLATVSFEEPSNESKDLLRRAASVFDLAYKRFLDLKKAEAQARESEIQLALERVRARTMAMQSSRELSEAASVLFKQLRELGGVLWSSGFVLLEENNEEGAFWMSNPEGEIIPPIYIPNTVDPATKNMYANWKKGSEYYYEEAGGRELKAHYKYLMSLPKSGHVFLSIQDSGFSLPTWQQWHAAYFSHGYLLIITMEPFSERDLFVRFAKVFEQTYTRFLDLKKAEEQAREAQIEASLERIRAKAMAMHSSEDISEATTIVFSELEHLGIKTMRCGIGIMDNNWGMEAWTAASTEKKEEVIKIIGQFDMTKHPALRGVYEAWKNQQDYFSYNLFGKDAQKYYEYVNKRPDYSVPKSKSILEKHTLNVFNFAEGGLFAFTEEPLAKESISILQRFTSVFTLTYRRYLDLIQAETQTREAQIEAGLERVRASTMAMHKSEQLSETAMVLFDQFYQLGQVPDRISIAIFNPSKKCFEFRVTDQSGSQLSNSYNATIEESTTIHKIYKAWKNGEKSAVIQLTGHNLKKWIRFVKEEMKLHIDEKKIQDRRIHHAAFFSHGFLMYTSNTFMEPEFINLLVRFANVFDQTYTRFLDLQKAEAQAREAQIEASLERIRARAMAMQKSDELREVVGLVSEELNISLENTICIIMNFDWKSKEIEWWSTGFNVDNLPESYKIPIRDTIKDHPLIRHYREALQRGISYKVYKLEGEIKRSWEKYVFEQSELTKIPLETQNWMRSYEGVISNEAFMSHGVLQVDGPKQLSDENAEILKRFAKVVDLTYTRVEDLQQAEARAMEAVRQASLDRVRGVIASMRSKEDLNRITPLIWKELKALGVPFIRCGVFIMDVKNEIIQSYLSTPDGKTLGIFNLPFTSELIGELMVNSWQIGKIYRDHWTRKQFVDFMKRLNETGQLKDTSAYQGTVEPPEKLDLHFIPFKQGMLYVGNTEPLTKDELILVKSLAETFSIAYARYEDFRELELAKNQIEETLNELKATQSQLIHAEKMASLGELTAGIAHEIQNPLNFVNNFSDVSIDLIGELKDERNKKREERDESLEMEILDDVIQNLEKINHHGLRASSIVKGMLEHSRTGSKEKQLVDINALVDEYLRLAYHGLRAKNKSFNADFKTDFDESMPKIEVVPQDIGRVLLNLINNAFYASSSKAFAKEDKDYKPLVTVSTQKLDDRLEINVKDNGPGIPSGIKEKIFQPFFTTKPTGKGTGLGLSLSYDIIKAHGGEIKVESVEGEGTEFTIVLGLNTD